MAGITKGTDGTLESVTVEGQLLELATWITIAEKDTVKNPQALDYITIDISGDASLATIRYDFPVVANSIAGGGYTYDANEFLTSGGFAPGTGGDITDGASLGYFKRLVEMAQELEAPLQPTVDRISATVNINNKTFAGTIEIPLTTAIDASGNMLLTAQEWL